MTTENTKKLEIVGAIASILALLWALFLRPAKGASGLPGSQGPPGSVGPQGGSSVGYQGMTGAAGAPGAPGTPGVVSPAGSDGAAGVNPSQPAAASTTGGGIIDNFVQMFSPDPSPVPQSFTSAAAPRGDIDKLYAGQAEPPKGGGGCGCGGGKSGKCSNRPPASKYPDGGGSCLSSTMPRLAQNINNCYPDNIKNQIDNMQSNVKYAGILPSIWDMVSNSANVSDISMVVPKTLFGAS